MILDYELTERRDGALVIALRGHLICCREVTQLHELLQQICAKTKYHVVLEMRGVKRFDSFGEDYLGLLQRMLARIGRHLLLINIDGVPKKIFMKSKMASVIPVCNSVDDALLWIEAQSSSKVEASAAAA